MGLFSFHLRYLQVTMWYGSGKSTALMKAILSDVAVICTTNEICAGWGELASDTNKELEEPQEIQCY